MRMKGLPITLDVYAASEVRTNRHFEEFKLPEFEGVYLPESMRPFTDVNPSGTKGFIVDDNRGAVATSPSLTIDGTDFYFSVKGIGSTTNPFSRQLLSKGEMCSLLTDPELKDRIMNSKEVSPRYLTAELWQRYSPYGGQGLEHASYSMRASEMDDLTSIHGFRIAPLVKIVFLPEDLENKIKQLYWYRRFGGRIVQETRLVPSNVRVYFHSGITVGGTVSSVFELFEIDDNDKALAFLKNFVKSGIAFLTLFARSMKNNEDGTFSGLDFYDVWLDKDAVIDPEGTVYFVDLEGLDWITIDERAVQEKIYSQIYRSLYEFMYAYEQIERERSVRFGVMTDRKVQFEYLLREALKDDEVIDLEREGKSLVANVGNILAERKLAARFPILNW
jgi:hypothetical protein